MDISSNQDTKSLVDIRLKLELNSTHKACDLFNHLQVLRNLRPRPGLTEQFRHVSEKMSRMVHEAVWGPRDLTDSDDDTACALLYEILDVELRWMVSNSDDWLYNAATLEQMRWSLRENGFTHLQTSHGAPTVNLPWLFPEEPQCLVLLASPESQLEFKSFDDDSGLGSDIQEPVVTFAPLFTVLPHSDVPQANRLHSVVERTSQDGGGNSALLDSQQEQATVFLEELQSNPEISTTAFVPPRTIQSQLKFAPTTVSVNTD